jgi:uncharacterized protein YjbJ (UPF0337 family)
MKGGESMGTLRDVGQKIKGKVQQVQGDLNQDAGHGVKGGLQKLKGKTNEVIADTKLRAREKKARQDDVLDDEYDW